MATKSVFRHPSSDFRYLYSDLSDHINKILQYFSNFDYIPTREEIYRFYPKKISKSTVGEYSKKVQSLKCKVQSFEKERKERKLISERKVNLIQSYIKILSKFPQIKLVGLSGTVAMNNAQENDDIDLFIITAENRLFTGRLIAILLAQLLNLRRKRNNNNVIASDQVLTNTWERGNPCLAGRQVATNKTVYINGIASSSRPGTSGFPRNDIRVKDRVCLNLFFDESNLQVPKYKQTEYVAHEVLQMKPVINKDQIYERFIKANAWVFKIFPNSKFETRNSKLETNPKNKIQNRVLYNLIIHLLAVGFELIAKHFQLTLINRHRTTEIITKTQLWFFPDDYELKIREMTRIKKIK